MSTRTRMKCELRGYQWSQETPPFVLLQQYLQILQLKHHETDKEKKNLYQLFPLPSNSLFGLIPDSQRLSGKRHLLPCWRMWASGPRPFIALPEGMPCPQPSSLSYPAPSGKPKTQRHAGSGCHCPLLCVRHDQHASTCFHNYFLFLIVIPLFLDPLTTASCPLLPCFPVPFPFHFIELSPYFCFPAPGT